MKKLITCTIVLFCTSVAPAVAALAFVATPNLASYSGPTTGNLALSVALNGMPTGSIQFVTGPVLSASPISFSFVAQVGASGSLPSITSTSVNSAGGWNSVIAPTSNTFTAFNFSPQPLPPSELVGQANFSILDATTNGNFDLMASAFALDGVDFPGQVIGTITVVPEPTSALLVACGLLGLVMRRRRTVSV